MLNAILLILLKLTALSYGLSIPDSNRIVGGDTARNGSYPYQVSLRFTNNQHFCGGSILTPKTILTAAHCIHRIDKADFVVVVGTNSLKQGGESYRVKKLKLHRLFDPILFTNDIGIVIVTERIKFSPRVQPIKITNNFIDAGVWLTLTGWGTTSYPGKLPDNLQMIELKSITNEDCKILTEKLLYYNQICTLNGSGQGACSGDFGGPLVSNGMQIGILSWGVPCAKGYPDIFTRTSGFAWWIWLNTVK